MSGYLRRLAGQALGQPSGVRPPARLPWLAAGPAPHDRASWPQDGGEARADAASASDHGIGADQRPDMPPDVRIGRRPPPERIEAERSVRPAAQAEARAAPDQDGAADPPRPKGIDPPHAKPDAGTEPRGASRPHRIFPAHANPASGRDSDPAAAAPPSDHVRPRRQPRPAVELSHADLTPDRTRSARAETTPRVSTRVARADFIPRRSQPGADRPPATAEPAPDVHIHIGRVELTAVATPAAPRREPPNAKKPMALDEYLRRRNGRAP